MYKYAIKRLTFGVASVAISAGLMFAGGTVAGAEEVPTDEVPATTEGITVLETESNETGEANIDPSGEPVTVLTDESEGEASEVETPKVEAPEETQEITEDTVDQSENVESIQFTEEQKAQLREAGFTEEEIIALEVEAQTEGVIAVEGFITEKIIKRKEKIDRQIQTRSAETGLGISDEIISEAVGAAGEENEFEVSGDKVSPAVGDAAAQKTHLLMQMQKMQFTAL